MIGRVEIILWVGGTKHPLSGPAAAEALASALVDIVNADERVRPHLDKPVAERVERIYLRVHRLVEDAFQYRWKRGLFNR